MNLIKNKCIALIKINYQILIMIIKTKMIFKILKIKIKNINMKKVVIKKQLN